MSGNADEQTEQALKDEILHPEVSLHTARAKLNHHQREEATTNHVQTISLTRSFQEPSTLPSHALLLLSDSALPLGSFAFSSGLESYLAHTPRPTLPPFLSLSLQSVATTTLPYLLAAYRSPYLLRVLDATLDACTICPVARRASIAQGRALLTVWERSFRSTTVDAGSGACDALAEFAVALKSKAETAKEGEDLEAANGHFASVWAVVACAMGLAERDVVYVFLFNHAKAVVSAAVRSSIMGPYQAQGIVASEWLREEITRVMTENWEVAVEDAGQGAPMMDLWAGRHEILYSRIFNS